MAKPACAEPLARKSGEQRGSPQKTAFLAASLYRGGWWRSSLPAGFSPRHDIAFACCFLPTELEERLLAPARAALQSSEPQLPAPGARQPHRGTGGEETWGRGAAPRPLTASVGLQLAPCLLLRPVPSCRLGALGFGCPGEQPGWVRSSAGSTAPGVPRSASPPPGEARTHPREPLGSSHPLGARGWDLGVPA